jgi:hypothetical protein
MLHDPASRDPRGYILSADQPDFLTATKFVNTLIKNGIIVHQASRDFEVMGKSYPSGSYILKSAQAFRPHLLSMFEPQNYPDDIPCPGEPPRPTYDMAGWTLAFQMGVEFERILEGFDGPFEKIEGLAETPKGSTITSPDTVGFLLDHRVNDAFIATNRLLKAKEEVYWLKHDFETGGKTYPKGTIFIPKKASTVNKLEDMANEIGLNFVGISHIPNGEALRLKPLRMGLWDLYGGSMTSGWARWILEQFEFPFEVVYPPSLESEDLSERFDVLIFVSGAIPGLNTEQNQRYGRSAPMKPEEVPAEYRNRLGNVTVDKTVPRLLRFLKEGGTILTIGSSTDLGFHAGLPIKDALVEKTPDGKETPLSRAQLFIPGSLLQVRIDTSHPLAYGMEETADVVFNRSPVFKLQPDAQLKGVRPIAWFDSNTPLSSGWAWGQHHLEGGTSVIEAKVGEGKLVCMVLKSPFAASLMGHSNFYSTACTTDLLHLSY